VRSSRTSGSSQSKLYEAMPERDPAVNTERMNLLEEIALSRG
jgi:hypothetical protein